MCVCCVCVCVCVREREREKESKMCRFFLSPICAEREEKLAVSFAEYSLFYIALLQKRPIMLRGICVCIGSAHVHPPKAPQNLHPFVLEGLVRTKTFFT